MLGKDRATLADDQGLFLDRTWRLHPAICAFTSELYYEGRLHPVDGLERQRLEGNTPFAGAGLFVVEVPHEGNQSRSNEEIDAVEGIARRLLADTRWTDQEGRTRPLAPSDILVVASPALFEADCGTPEQMQWANGLCRCREVVTGVPRN